MDNTVNVGRFCGRIIPWSSDLFCGCVILWSPVTGFFGWIIPWSSDRFLWVHHTVVASHRFCGWIIPWSSDGFCGCVILCSPLIEFCGWIIPCSSDRFCGCIILWSPVTGFVDGSYLCRLDYDITEVSAEDFTCLGEGGFLGFRKVENSPTRLHGAITQNTMIKEKFNSLKHPNICMHFSVLLCFEGK